MIIFFRKIRKQLADDNKPLKYARYAIGEIVLVVIGILIALQINSWYADRITRANEQMLLINIIENLSTDYQTTFELLHKVKRRQEIHLQLHNASIAKVITEQSDPYSAEIVEKTDIISITWDNHKNSIEKISIREIRNELNQYFSSHSVLLKYNVDLNDVILNQFRPYLGTHRIINHNAVFESSPDKDDFDRLKFFHVDRLESKIGTHEFNMLIVQLFLGTVDVIQSLEIKLEYNLRLQAELKAHLY
jgi:hypothetical protein